MNRRTAVLVGVVAVIVIAAGLAVTVVMRGGNGRQAQGPEIGGSPAPSACSSASAQLGSPASPGSLASPGPAGPAGSQDDPAVPGPTPGGASGASPVAPSGPAQDTAAAAGLRPVSQWDEEFQRQWQSERNTAEQLSHSRDSWDHYTLSYSIDALTADYLATGRQEAIDEALSLTENVVAAAVPSNQLPRSRYHDGYLGWSSAEQSGQEVPLYESYFWRYATSLLRVVGRTPSLADDPGIGPRYRRLLTFAEHDVFDKWFTRGADQDIFRSRTHLSAHWALIALNLSDITADPARRVRYRQVVTAIDQKLPNYDASLRGQMVAEPDHGGAYFWSDIWGSCARPGQDVAHGNGVIAYVVEAHDQNVDWTDADISAFVHTLSDVIWPGPGPGSAFVDGSGTGTGWFSDGFVKLGRYDIALQRRLETHQPANGQFYANGALNAAVLLCPAGHPTSSGAPDPAVSGSAAAAPVCSTSSAPAP